MQNISAKQKPEYERWDDLAKNYDQEVYSLTKYPEKRSRIVGEINDETRVFVAGGGSATHLQKHILEKKQNIQLVLGDLSLGMLQVSRDNFSNNKINHVGTDTRKLPFKKETFNAVISTNSIIAETRDSVQEMFNSLYDVLDSNGKLIVYLPSYEAAEKFSLATSDVVLKLDHENFRVWDTVGWQCFHTRETIMNELSKAGFCEIIISNVKAESEEEICDLNSLYGSEQAGDSFSEHFVVAKKSKQNNFPKIDFVAKKKESDSTISCLKTPEITLEKVNLVSRLYKEVFDNKGHFLYNPKKHKFFTPADIFGEKRWYSFDELNELNNLNLFDPQTGEPLVVFHDAEKVKSSIEKKLKKDEAYLVLLGNVGFTFATKTTLEKARIMEGWADPLYYSNSSELRQLRSPADFYEKINRAIYDNSEFLNVPQNTQLHEKSEIISFNAIGIIPGFRGKKAGGALVQSLIGLLPKKIMKDCFDIAECTAGKSLVHNVKSGKIVFVPGILSKEKSLEELKEGESILTIDKLSNYN